MATPATKPRTDRAPSSRAKTSSKPEAATPTERRGGPPVHVLSAFVTIILDLGWTLGDIVGLVGDTVSVGLATVVMAILAGVTCFLAVFAVQLFVAKDDIGSALAKGLVLGIAAGVPFPVAGTAVGGLLLVWAGVSGLRGMLSRN